MFAAPAEATVEAGEISWLELVTGQTLQDLAHVEELWLDGAGLSHFPTPILRLNKLWYLVLSNNAIASLPELSLQASVVTDIDETPHNPISSASASKNETAGVWTLLRVFVMSHNVLTQLPDSISCLKSLEALYLSHNDLTALPESVTALTRIRVLHLSHNRLSCLPASMGCLSALKEIDFSRNHLTVLPDSTSALAKLRTLDVSFNRLSVLPGSLDALGALRELNVSHNALSVLPDSLTGLSHLQSLLASHNSLCALPPAISRMSDLQTLSLLSNRLSVLPPALGQLKRLTSLVVEENPLRSPPASCVKEGLPAIRLHLQQLELHPAEPSTLKGRILVLGTRSCGKSTLIAALIQKYTLFWSSTVDELRPPTETITVDSQRLELQLSDQALQSSDQAARVLSLEMWEMPDNDALAPCIPLFLSHGSLVLVVWSVLTGPKESLLDKWLHLISAAAPGCRVVLVGTSLDSAVLQPSDAERWQAELDSTITPFRHILRIHPAWARTSGRTGEGIEGLKTTITEVCQTLPFVTATLPHKFTLLTDVALEWRSSRAVPVAGLEEFYRVGKSLEITHSQVETVLAYLHDQGTVIWTAAREFRNLVILDPSILIEAVTLVPNLKRVISLRDTVPRNEIPIHHPACTDERMNVSVELLRHYSLAFPYHPDSECFPALLSPQLPPPQLWEIPLSLHWARQVTLSFRYTLLPSGLFPRLVSICRDFAVRNKGNLMFFSASHFLLFAPCLHPHFPRPVSASPLLCAYASLNKQRHRIQLRIRLSLDVEDAGVSTEAVLQLFLDCFDKIHGAYLGVEYDVGILCPTCQLSRADVAHSFSYHDIVQRNPNEYLACDKGHLQTASCILRGSVLPGQDEQAGTPGDVGSSASARTARQPNLFVVFVREGKARLYPLCEAPSGPHRACDEAVEIFDWDSFRRIFYHRLLVTAHYLFQFIQSSEHVFERDDNEHMDLKALFLDNGVHTLSDYETMLSQGYEDKDPPPCIQHLESYEVAPFVNDSKGILTNTLRCVWIQSGHNRWVCGVHALLYDSA